MRPVRPTFFALLFMNVVYFAWAHWIDAPKPAPVNEAIVHLPRLKLIDEIPPAERPQAHAAQKTSLSSTTACLSVGPFVDPGSSARAAALLEVKGFEPWQRPEQGHSSQSYWVYVAGLSQSEAGRALVALEHNGITDARVMPENGEAGRRLSLGLYSERPRAERRAEAVRQSGLKAEIAERKLAGTLYWVDVTPPPGVSAVSLQDLFAEGINSQIAVQPCPPPVPPAPTTTAGTAAATPRPMASLSATARNPTGPAAGPPKLP